MTQETQVGTVDYSYWSVQAQERDHMIYPLYPSSLAWHPTNTSREQLLMLVFLSLSVSLWNLLFLLHRHFWPISVRFSASSRSPVIWKLCILHLLNYEHTKYEWNSRSIMRELHTSIPSIQNQLYSKSTGVAWHTHRKALVGGINKLSPQFASTRTSNQLYQTK